MSQAAHRQATADAAKTAAGPLVASRTAAIAGPKSVDKESSIPRTTFAPASSVGVRHRDGTSAEWTGRKSTPVTVATTARP